MAPDHVRMLCLLWYQSQRSSNITGLLSRVISCTQIVVEVRLDKELNNSFSKNLFFGDGDCGAGEIHTRTQEISRRRDARGAPKISSSRVPSPRNFARTCVSISPAPQSVLLKLETTCSLQFMDKSILDCDPSDLHSDRWNWCMDQWFGIVHSI